uniref:ATP-dependent helicase C-terminal domain-containing protein n=1 Tax=Aureoumbra lagunensis TaxID=44058 RepID=A0A7S3JWL8_9STRA
MLFNSTSHGGPLIALLKWLRLASRGEDPSPLMRQEPHWCEGRQVRVWSGTDAAHLVREVIGLISCDTVDANCKILWKLRKTLIEEGLESGAVRSDMINDLEALLIKLRFLLLDDASSHYRLIVRGTSRNDSLGASLSFCCLSGTVAMRTLLHGQRAVGLGEASYLKPARSMLLLSGTLRPFNLCARELGFTLFETDNEISPTVFEKEEKSRTYEASAIKAVHLKSIENQTSLRYEDYQLLALHVPVAAGGTELDASHRNINDPDAPCAQRYFDALAQAIYGIALATPNGVLVFFKSYKLLEDTLNYWNTQWRTKISTVKPLFVEERNLTGDDFDSRVRDYKIHAKSQSGAILLAVMRGRAAEGADFKDEAARVVAIVGLPYPPLLDTAIQLKKDHEDRIHGSSAGNKWYAAEAWRSINQAAGRLIRHHHDFGALILLDKALFNKNQKPPNELMSDWYARHLETLNGATSLYTRLRDFFAHKTKSATKVVDPPRTTVLNQRPPNSSTHHGTESLF